MHAARSARPARRPWPAISPSAACFRRIRSIRFRARSIRSRARLARSQVVSSFCSIRSPLLDLAASQIDVFVAGTMPLVYSFADVPAIQADVRSLKNRVVQLRQQAAAGQPASVLKQSLSGMIGDYVDAFNRWNNDVAASRLPNPAPLSPVGETLNRVEQTINQALASGELTPTGPTRAAQDLAQLTAEVNTARQAVAAL